jgi:peptidoglycan/LPS O-acetylase OafA/YrhL
MEDGLNSGKLDAARFRSLDAWRGICALFVAALHFQTVGWIHNSLLVQNSGRFVDFFFVLSGFVIAHAYRHRLEAGGWRQFLLRRIGRLWPLHLVTLAVTIAMAVAGSFIGLTVRIFDYSAIPANISMTHAWGYLNRLTWNGPSWSISAELFAYGYFALLATTLRGWRLDLACGVTLILGFVLTTFVAPQDFAAGVDFSVARCLFGFMAGVLALRLLSAGCRPRGEALAVIVTFATVAFLPRWLEPLIIPVFVWTVLVFSADAGLVSRALQRRFPQHLGRVSYSIYMDHYLIGLTIITAFTLFTPLTAEVDGNRTIITHPALADALTIAYLGTVVAVATVTYVWIERPGRAWFNGRGKPVPTAW